MPRSGRSGRTPMPLAPPSACSPVVKLVQMPRGFGTCRVGEARWREDVVEQALALLRALGYHGIAQTEFRLDPRDGRFKLMEVNPPPLAVAWTGARLRGRPAAHRLPRRARPSPATRALGAEVRRPALGRRGGTSARGAAGGHAAAASAAGDGPGRCRGHLRRARSAAGHRAGRRSRDRADRAPSAPPQELAVDPRRAMARPPLAGDADRHHLAQAPLGPRCGRRHARGHPGSGLRRALPDRPRDPARCPAPPRRPRAADRHGRARGGLPGRLTSRSRTTSNWRSTPRAWPSSRCTSASWSAARSG